MYVQVPWYMLFPIWKYKNACILLCTWVSEWLAHANTRLLTHPLTHSLTHPDSLYMVFNRWIQVESATLCTKQKATYSPKLNPTVETWKLQENTKMSIRYEKFTSVWNILPEFLISKDNYKHDKHGHCQQVFGLWVVNSHIYWLFC